MQTVPGRTDDAVIQSANQALHSGRFGDAYRLFDMAESADSTRELCDKAAGGRLEALRRAVVNQQLVDFYLGTIGLAPENYHGLDRQQDAIFIRSALSVSESIAAARPDLTAAAGSYQALFAADRLARNPEYKGNFGESVSPEHLYLQMEAAIRRGERDQAEALVEKMLAGGAYNVFVLRTVAKALAHAGQTAKSIDNYGNAWVLSDGDWMDNVHHERSDGLVPLQGYGRWSCYRLGDRYIGFEISRRFTVGADGRHILILPHFNPVVGPMLRRLPEGIYRRLRKLYHVYQYVAHRGVRAALHQDTVGRRYTIEFDAGYSYGTHAIDLRSPGGRLMERIGKLIPARLHRALKPMARTMFRRLPSRLQMQYEPGIRRLVVERSATLLLQRLAALDREVP